ncbi:MAG: response regulator transcription factor [Planctomycetaceae bacterium]|nr:response regulator transcription factor [Planctomycetaceae bacterium]
MTELPEKSACKTRLILVDDHPIVRQGIAMLVEKESDMEVCGEASSANEALTLIKQAEPHVAVVDLSLKDSNGIDLIKDIAVRFPQLRVLVLSMRDEAFFAERVLRAGARGYLTKEQAPRKVIEAIRMVMAGEIYVSDKISATVIRKFVQGHAAGAGSLDALTDRELEIFEMIGGGLPTREIARRLHISSKTVDSHREHIKGKLRLASSSDLLKYAIGWVQHNSM